MTKSRSVTADLEPKGRMLLQEVSQIEPVKDAKNVFRIASPDCEIQFQAPSTCEMNEWFVFSKFKLVVP